MEHEYLYEKPKLPENLQAHLEDLSINRSDVDYCCPYCGSLNVYEGYLNENGNMVYCCDECESEMLAEELDLFKV